MKLKLTAVFGALLLVGLSTPAYAGWKNVQWGMTKAAVMKLYPQATEDRSVTTDDALLSIKDVDYADIHWERVDFVIDGSNHLRQVILVSHMDRFPALKQQLASQFGAPVTQATDRAQFLDRKRNNAIQVSYDQYFGLRVTYSKPSSF